jgi:hypothetical protein
MYVCMFVCCIYNPDDNRKSVRDMVVINNVLWNMFYSVYLLVLLRKFK